MALRKTRLGAGILDGLLDENVMRALMTPQPYIPRVRVTARGVFLSVPLCAQKDRIGMAIAKVNSQRDYQAPA